MNLKSWGLFQLGRDCSLMKLLMWWLFVFFFSFYWVVWGGGIKFGRWLLILQLSLRLDMEGFFALKLVLLFKRSN